MNEDRIANELTRIASALEGILARLTPAEERDRSVAVNGYVRSANNGGDLVWLYGQHPGLQWKVATVYSEDFGALRPFMNPGAGKVYDGEVAPSREAAAKKGYITEVAPFEVILSPTGKKTDNDAMIYDFKTARPLATDTPPAAAPAQPPKPQPAPTQAPTQAPTGPSAAEQDFASWPSAADGLKIPPIEPKGGHQPQIGRSAKPADPAPVQPANRRPANIGPGAVGARFREWAKTFAARYPHYRIGKSEDPDLYHILISTASLTGVDTVTEENMLQVIETLEQHAATKEA